MPLRDPWNEIRSLQRIEADLRNGRDIDISALDLDDYWKDLASLLKIYALTRENIDGKKLKEVAGLKRSMSTSYYSQYIRRREQKAPPAQLGLPEIK